MRRRTVLSAIFVASFLVSCSDNSPEEAVTEEQTVLPAGPTEESSTEEQAEPGLPDTEAPILLAAFEHTVLSWGRIRWSWTAAVDDRTPRHLMDYRIIGSIGAFFSSSGDEDGPETVEISPPTGSIEHAASAPVTHSVWQAYAVDESGNWSEPIAAQHILLRPRLRNLLTGGVDGKLTACSMVDGEKLFCAGEFGRYATWDGSVWLEEQIDTPSTVRLERDAEGRTLFITDHGRYELGEDGPELLEDEFAGRPTPPMGRSTVEPSGLFFWLDKDGHLWGSDGSRFQLIDNPLLLSSENRCEGFNDFYFTGPIGFAWCNNGSQYAMRLEQRGYRWQQLTEADTLSTVSGFQRAYAFGTGRQITVLTWGGDVLRYEMGGWRTLLASNDGLHTTAMATSDDPQRLLVGVDRQLLSVDALGETELVAELPVTAAPIYIAPPGQEPLVVSENGEVVRFDSQELLRAPPGGGFKRRYLCEGTTAGIWASLEGDRLFKWNAPSWSVREITHGDPSFVLNGLVQKPDGTLYLAGESAEVGGRIGHLSTQGFLIEPFLYPPPLPEVDPETLDGDGTGAGTEGSGATGNDATGELGRANGAPMLSDELPAEGEGEGAESEDPAVADQAESLPNGPPPLVGVLPDSLPTPPPIPPPVTAIDWDAASGTAVAVGMGGSLWYRIENATEASETGEGALEPVQTEPPLSGWLAIDTGVFMPFLTVRVLGPGHYVAAGSSGLLLECHEAVCEMTVLQVGDVLRLLPVGDDLFAVGTTGLARRVEPGSWEPMALQYAPPFPLENAPEVVLSIDQHEGRRWVLGTDGTIWMGEPNEPLWAMGIVDAPVDLWIDHTGRAVIATERTLYRIDPPVGPE